MFRFQKDNFLYQIRIIPIKNRDVLNISWTTDSVRPSVSATISFDANDPVFLSVTIWKFTLFVQFFAIQGN